MSRTPIAAVPDLPNADDKPRVVEEMFDRIAPRYDALKKIHNSNEKVV